MSILLVVYFNKKRLPDKTVSNLIYIYAAIRINNWAVNTLRNITTG